MKRIIMTLVALGSLTFAHAQKNKKMDNKATTTTTLANDKDSVSYALGVLIGKNLKNQGFGDIDLAKFEQAVKDVFENKPTLVNEMEAQTTVQKCAQEQQMNKSKKNIAEGKAYLEQNKKKPGVTVTASGLQYEVLKEGDGSAKPGPTSQVTAHYHGTLIDGTVFDSSVQRGQPFKTGVNQVIAAWQEALQLMSPGTKLRIVCPSEIAYGDRGAGGAIGPNTVLIFEMELISIDKP